jgi:hypothetical protein
VGVYILAIGALVAVAYFLIEASGGMGTTANSAAGQIALAIGVAEGGYDATGANRNNGVPASINHNPGNLTVDVNGTGSGSSGGFVVYPSDAVGYAALEYQINEWLQGTSANAGPDSTIDQISQFYTTDVPPGAQAAWAANVAATLGVLSSTPISQIGNPQAATTAAVEQVPAPIDDSGDLSASDEDQVDATPDVEDDNG